MNAEEFVSRLDHARPVGRGRWIARCPAHTDRTPSLSVTEGDDGRVLIYCHAECDPHAIVDAVGLDLSDLFPSKPNGEGSKTQRTCRMRCGLTVKEAVALLKRDALITAVAADNIARHVALTEDDRKLLRDVVGRINNVWEVKYGRR